VFIKFRAEFDEHEAYEGEKSKVFGSFLISDPVLAAPIIQLKIPIRRGLS
jgi:hypothetical protein